MTTAGGVGVGVGAGRFMAYSPSPSAPHSPHISGLRSSAASSALVVEQEKYNLSLSLNSSLSVL